MPAPLTTTLLIAGIIFAICGVVPAAAALAGAALSFQFLIFIARGSDGLGT